MGRWTWVTLKGKLEKKTTVISTYRAVNQQATAGRQAAVIRRKHPTKDPEKAWEEDMIKLVEEKRREGGVIVAGDFNDDLNEEDGRITSMFRELGMREILNSRYGKGPNTYFRGSNKIDGIFCTNEMELVQGGYIPEGNSPGDHKCVWMDLAENSVVGSARDDRPPPLLRKATSKIPSVRKAFSELLNEELQRNKVYSKAEALIRKARENKVLSTQDAQMYEGIEERLRRAVRYGDKRCRKARRACVRQSPVRI